MDREERKKERKLVKKAAIRQNKWTMAVSSWLIGIVMIAAKSARNTIPVIPIGIILLILGFMACPKITDYTQNNEKLDIYTEYKGIIVTVLVILLVGLIFLG